MIYRVSHQTSYAYTDTIAMSLNHAHLRPRDRESQSVRWYRLIIDPPADLQRERRDYFGNHVTYFSLSAPHQQMVVTAESEIEVRATGEPTLFATPPWESIRDQLRRERSREGLDAYQYVFASPHVPTGPPWAEYAAGSFTPGRPLWEAVLDLTNRIHAEFAYDARATTVATPLEHVFEQRRGVCQDFAHLEIACLRSIGLAARYVSGYLSTRPPPGRPRLRGADASHAWLSVYCPGFGWLDIDPTNNLAPSESHVTVGWGRDYQDVSPVKGVLLGGGEHTVNVAVDVDRV